MALTEAARCINILARFCGPRDVPAPSLDAVRAQTGGRADAVVLFGGSIIAGCDALAEAIRGGCADLAVIAGGEGHTTETFRREVARLHPSLATAGHTEARILDDLLAERHGMRADLLETESRNSGENARNVIRMLRDRDRGTDNLVLIHDSTMQRRMAAVFRRRLGDAATLTSYAAYRTEVVARDGTLQFAERPVGMWSVDEYARMLLGEVARLTDDEAGYGPRGRGFIAHVEVPDAVRRAADALIVGCGATAREADGRWATTDEL